MTSKVTISFTLAVEADGTVAAFSISEDGIPPEKDEDNPKSPEGIVSGRVHEAVRATIHNHNENLFREAVTRSRS